MIGMDFLGCLWLVIIAAVVSIIMYYVFKLRLLGGYWSQLIIGWIGAWLGSPVFGHWVFKLPVLKGGKVEVYLIPAIIGSIVLIWLVRAAETVCSKIVEAKEKTVVEEE